MAILLRAQKRVKLMSVFGLVAHPARRLSVEGVVCWKCRMMRVLSGHFATVAVDRVRPPLGVYAGDHRGGRDYGRGALQLLLHHECGRSPPRAME